MRVVLCGSLAVLVACTSQARVLSGPTDSGLVPSDAGWHPDAATAHDAWSPGPSDARVTPPDANDAADVAIDAAPSVRDAALPVRDAALVPDANARDGGVTSGAGEYQNIVVDGNVVTVYLPHFTDPAQAVPVVLSLHGLSIPAIAMADITGLPAVADREGFIAIFPPGVSGTWNTGGAVCGLGSFAGNAADDVTYVEHMLDEVEKVHPIDRARVFLSGFSMGGYGTNALACRRPDLFRAAAPAAGGFPTTPCAPGKVPVMIFHGTADGTIAHQCGVDARAAWVAHNSCSAEVDVVPIMGGQCEWSRGCPEGGQVVFCSFMGMGHGWAGSLNPFAFGGAQFESATSLMWSFFKAQR